MRTASLLALFAVPVLFTACGSSTKVVSSWRDPETTIQQGHYKKMLCIALVKDETNRRVAEDKLATLLPGKAVESYRYLGTLPDSVDSQAMEARLRNDGIDGIVIMRLAKQEKEVSFVPGSYPMHYASPWGYYGYAMPYYADPGYVRTDNYYFIETNLYDMAKGKLVWTGITSSWEPSSVSSTVEEVVNAVVRKMRDEKFLEAPPKQ
jgi:hypothetical protein